MAEAIRERAGGRPPPLDPRTGAVLVGARPLLIAFNVELRTGGLEDARAIAAAIRASGRMYGKDGALHDMKAVIPDRSYAGIYQSTIAFCKAHGAFDPRTMGSVSNIGLMVAILLWRPQGLYPVTNR